MIVTVLESALDKAFVERVEAVRLLTPQQEHILATRARRGDADARRRLIEANLRLVLRIALRQRYRGVELNDLVQDGATGLIQAVDRFDDRRGFRFSTLATIVIRSAIYDALERGHLIRLPPSRVRQLRRMRTKEDELRHWLGRTPSDGELAHATDLTADDVATLRAAAARPASLDELPGTRLADDRGVDQVVAAAVRADVRCAVSRLPPRERFVIERRFGLVGEQTTLAEVGQELGLTHERVRQIEASALEQLREVLKDIAYES
jgi:RNA polymerase sigma factor (sigma-70 family)